MPKVSRVSLSHEATTAQRHHHVNQLINLGGCSFRLRRIKLANYIKIVVIQYMNRG